MDHRLEYNADADTNVVQHDDLSVVLFLSLCGLALFILAHESRPALPM
jgi:hypothetical protein